MAELVSFDVPRLLRTPRLILKYLLGRHPAVPSDKRGAALADSMFREELGTTGIGTGVAVPQVIAPWVSQTSVVAGRLATPVNWTDGSPVQVVYLIVAPDPSGFMTCLTAISRHLREQRFQASGG